MRGYRTIGLVISVLAIALFMVGEARAGLFALGARLGELYRSTSVIYGPQYEAATMAISQPRTLFVLGATLVGVGLVGRQLIRNQPFRGGSPPPGGIAQPAPTGSPSGVRRGGVPGLGTPPREDETDGEATSTRIGRNSFGGSAANLR
jgi:hypothetical protein